MAKNKEVTKEQIDKDLLTVAKKFDKEFPDKAGYVPRAYYRNHGKYGSTFSRFYDNFSDFKRLVLNPDLSSLSRPNINSKTDHSKKRSKRRYFVTAAIAGCATDPLFLKSVQTYCDENDAKLVVLPMRGVRTTYQTYPQDIMDAADFFDSEFKFNDSLTAMDMMIKPQQINPLTGLNRLGQKDYSVVIASPKQQMKMVPVSTGKLPHTIISTGTVSVSDYTNERVGKIGNQDHIVGGLIVEIENKDRFYIREIQSDALGGFSDLDKYYSGDEVTTKHAEAIYGGDYHSGWEDPKAVAALFQQIELLKPKYFYVGDFFDATSISHHHEKDILAQLQRPNNIDSLEKELHHMAGQLNNLRVAFPWLEIMLVRGNHDEHLDRYLGERRFHNDRMNYEIAIELTHYYIKGLNPLEEWLRIHYPEVYEKVTFLKRVNKPEDVDTKIAGIELSQHGDQGANGAWGSALNLELSYGNCVVGHLHSPEILRGVWIVGHLCVKALPYVKNASSWLQANCTIYDNGQRQMLKFIQDNWRL